MLFMVEKVIRGGIFHIIYRYGKAINKCIKNYDKNKKSSYLNYWDVDNLYGWAMYNRCTKNCFKKSKWKRKAAATGNIIHNNITDKITKISRNSPQNIPYIKQIIFSMIKKYLKKDIYLQNRTEIYWWSEININV